MIGYIFWHRPFADVGQRAYEEALTAFHRELAIRDTEGFRSSATYKISNIPWLDGQDGYEDWSFMESSAGLDLLNKRAVGPDMWDVHAGIANKMASGCGGLYYHVLGDTKPTELARVAWLTRPRGIRYEAPLKAIADQVSGSVSVWRRQMVLGSGSEFALLGEPPLSLDLPQGWEVHYVDRTLIYDARRIA